MHRISRIQFILLLGTTDLALHLVFDAAQRQGSCRAVDAPATFAPFRRRRRQREPQGWRHSAAKARIMRPPPPRPHRRDVLVQLF
jgi:hypothetical protein